jgi:hypothetical protein
MTTVNVNEDKYSVTVTEGATTVVTVKAPGPQGPGFPDGNLGDVTSSNTGASVVVNSGAITNAKVSASAAIAGTKISPDFGSQNITTTGNAVFGGNLTVSGTTTTIDSTTLRVEDKNIELGKVGSPTDITADGGGITLLGDTNHTFNWINATDSWTSSEHIALPDNKKLQLGDSQDLQLYHNGSTSYITDAGTGDLVINSVSGGLQFRTNTTESSIKCLQNGAVELYFDNALKFTTKSFGATAFGTLTANGGDIKTINSTSSTDTNSFLLANSTGNAFQLTHTSSNSYIRNLVGSLFIEPKSGETGIKLTPDAGVELFYDNVKRAETLSTSFNIYGKAYVAGEIASFNCRFLQNGNDLFIDNNNGGSANRYTQISGGTLGTSAGLIKLYNAGQVELYHSSVKKAETSSDGFDVTGTVTDDGATHNGDVTFTGDSANVVFDKSDNALEFADNAKLVFGDGGDVNIRHDGVRTILRNHGIGPIVFDLLVSGNAFTITRANLSETIARFTPDAGVELYHDNVKRFGTATNGAACFGRLTMHGDIVAADNQGIKLGTGLDLNIYHSGVHSFVHTETGNLSLSTNSGKVQLSKATGDGTSNYEKMLEANANGSVDLYHDNVKKLETTSSGITVTGSVTTQDMNMSNLNGTANEVDGSKGSWSIQEGADDLFLINRVSGKKYKFNLTEIS